MFIYENLALRAGGGMLTENFELYSNKMDCFRFARCFFGHFTTPFILLVENLLFGKISLAGLKLGCSNGFMIGK